MQTCNQQTVNSLLCCAEEWSVQGCGRLQWREEVQLLVGPIKDSEGNEKERMKGRWRGKKAIEKQLLQHIENNLRFVKVTKSGQLTCVVSKRIPGSDLQSQSTGDWLMQNKDPIKHDKLSAPRSLLHCVQQSCELISCTRTRLQAPRECTAGIMLHCQHLRNIVPY